MNFFGFLWSEKKEELLASMLFFFYFDGGSKRFAFARSKMARGFLADLVSCNDVIRMTFLFIRSLF